MIGLNKTLKGLHVFGTDGEKAWIDAFHHEFKFAVHLTCFELCGVIWRKNCRNTWFLIANLKSKILNDIFGRQVGSTLFTGVIDSKSEAVFKQIKDQASSGQVEAKNSKETNWATPREMEAICMHQGQDFQSNHHEIGPWTEPESYMELSANGHTWLSFFRIHFLYFILFFLFVFGMTSALSVCRNCHFGFCTVWDVYAAEEGLLGQNITFYYSFKCYLQCFNKFLEQWTSVTLTGTLGLVLGPRLGIHELNPHDTNVGSNSFQQQGYK